MNKKESLIFSYKWHWYNAFHTFLPHKKSWQFFQKETGSSTSGKKETKQTNTKIVSDLLN